MKSAKAQPGENGCYYVGHELRHTTISLLVAADVSPHIIEQIVGQAELAKSYVHIDAAQVRTALYLLVLRDQCRGLAFGPRVDAVLQHLDGDPQVHSRVTA